SLASITTATTSAWNKWDQLSCSSLQFSFQGPVTTAQTPNVEDTYDAFNTSTIWLTQSSDPVYQSLFSTDVASVALPVSYSGVLVTCDIFMNAVTKQWSVATAPPA